MCKAPIEPKVKNEHKNRGRAWRPSLWTNKEVEHKEADRLAAATEDIFKDRAKDKEEEISALGRTHDGLKLLLRQTADPLLRELADPWAVHVPQSETLWPTTMNWFEMGNDDQAIFGEENEQNYLRTNNDRAIF